MKINEFKTELNGLAYTTTDKISGTINIYSNGHWEKGKRDEWFLQLAPARDTVVLNKRWSNLDDMPPFNLRDLLNLIAKLEGTPVEERFPEKKYRIRFSGLNSDNGHQYLSTDTIGIHGKFFACALRFGLKQEFTESEIDEMLNDPRFKSVPWFRELIRNGKEEVKDDE
jgi:hypothetical protein